MNYINNIKDPNEKKEIDELKASLLDRMEQNGENDRVDEKMAKRLATRLHIVEQASEYLQKHGLTQSVITDGGSYEKKQPVLDEIRRYDQSIVSDMKSLGILDDPETKKADALESWREYIG